MLKLDDQLAGLATMSPAQLRAEWRRTHKGAVPTIGAELMRRALAHELQERVHGGLAPAVVRELDRIAKRLARDGSCGADLTLKPGTRLVREWHGRTHHVLVLDQGFQFEDRAYRSLSKIAQAITGAKWSGPRFFGLSHSESADGADG